MQQAPFLFFFLFSLLTLAIATRSDLRERIVSNRLTYSMLAVGLLGHAAWAVLAGNWGILFNSAAAAGGIFLFSLILYRLGAWAGGDVKLFAGLAALNPLNPNIAGRLGLLSIPLFKTVSLPVFPFTLFLFSILAMLPYGIALALKRMKERGRHAEKMVSGVKTFAAGFAVAALLAVAAHLLGAREAVFPLLLVLAVWSAFFMLRLYSLSKVLMRKSIRVNDLEEGTIVAESVVEKNGKVERREAMGIKKLINQFAANKSRQGTQSEREIVSSWKAGGLTRKEIRELQGLARQGKIGERIMVKESAPFVPAVLIAYLALNIVGDVVWLALF